MNRKLHFQANPDMIAYVGPDNDPIRSWTWKDTPMALEHLPLARLRFDLRTREGAIVSPYKGDLLRMALLWWLSEYWCVMPDRCRRGCRRPEVCTFGRLCEPPVDPGWPAKIRHLVGNTPPPAYVLWDRHDRRRRLAMGTPWAFDLVLVGDHALQNLPAFVAAIQQGAEQGMGRVRLRNRLRQVSALTPREAAWQALPLAVEQPQGDEEVLTWQSYRLEDVAFGYRQAVEWAQAYDRPVHSLSLRYLSPTKIKMRGAWVEEPHFTPVMRALVRRLRLLSQVHGAGTWPRATYGPLLDLAETVQLEHDETSWTGYARRSRSSGRQEMEGFIGQAWYASDQDLRPLLPALWLGQWLHVGKGYVLGNGRYEIEQVLAS